MKQYIQSAVKYLLLVLFAAPVYAGLITHTDYTAGNVITAAGQNANENTIVNEINGNLSSANILDGGIATADLADSAVTYAKLASVVQSSFTYLNAMRTYRRPGLVYINATTVDIGTNTATANRTCVLFPDDVRCVTENTASTNLYRRFDITASCQFTTGTEDSGLYQQSEANNTWYSLYAVKSNINTSNFVICGSTAAPTVSNSSTLDTKFGSNGWVYIGTIRNGDGGPAPADIVPFRQSGSRMVYTNDLTFIGNRGYGILLSSVTSTSQTYTANPGTGTLNIPLTASLISYHITTGSGPGTVRFAFAANTQVGVAVVDNPGGATVYFETPLIDASQGANVTTGNSIQQDISIASWIDDVLASGVNPQL